MAKHAPDRCWCRQCRRYWARKNPKLLWATRVVWDGAEYNYELEQRAPDDFSLPYVDFP